MPGGVAIDVVYRGRMTIRYFSPISRHWHGLALAACIAAGGAAHAQVRPSAEVAVASDERRQGISWSDGKPVASARVTLRGDAGWDIGVRAVTLRQARRHGGADAVFDVTAGYGFDVGAGLRLDAFATGHLFTGARERLDYGEVGAGASYLIGPAELGVQARWAPAQDAIGGDALYLSASARAGVPLTPWSLSARVGRSTGGTDDPRRAARLRPAGRYTDWALGVERVVAGLTVGVDYVGTDIDRRRATASPFAVAEHAGDRVVARASFGF